VRPAANLTAAAVVPVLVDIVVPYLENHQAVVDQLKHL
jgi:hypothetical protein